MMRKAILLLAVVALVVGGALSAGAAATPEPAQQPAERPAANNPSARQAAVERSVRPIPVERSTCWTVRCFNRKLKQLERAVRQLQTVNFQCEEVLPVTQYAGYTWGFDGYSWWETTALDVTEYGDYPYWWVVVYTC